MKALYGMKWNPFSPGVPTEALYVEPRIDSFRRRIQQLYREGGFAIITGEPGTGKSAALRIVAEDLSQQRDVMVGTISRPQASLADFYRELGHLHTVPMRSLNRWNSAESLRKLWMTHIEESRTRPVLIIDEAQELKPPVLSELRLLASAKLDSVNLLTVILAGDMRLVDRLRTEEFLPLASRMRVRLMLDRADPETLEACLRHALMEAGTPKLIEDEVIATMADHACGNLRLLMNMGNELLAAAVEAEKRQIDAKLFFDVYPPTPNPPRNKALRRR